MDALRFRQPYSAQELKQAHCPFFSSIAKTRKLRNESAIKQIGKILLCFHNLKAAHVHNEATEACFRDFGTFTDHNPVFCSCKRA